MLLPALRSEWEIMRTKHTQLKTFLFGLPERLLDNNRSNVEYPLLMLEPPDFRLEGQNDTPLLTYSIDFSVLVQAEKGDEAGEENAWVLAQAIMLDIVAYLRKLHNKKGTPFYEYNNVSFERFDRFTTDNLFGYHAKMQLVTCENLAYKPEKWT